MKEYPIIFSGDHPRKMLDGIKTMTRRVIKPCSTATVIGKDGKVEQPDWVFTLAKCPYGQVGDRLWVRESWYYYGGDEYLYQQNPKDVLYKAGHIADPETGMLFIPRWRPSIFMPRWASRITLEITEVRVERLQEISTKDKELMAEGIPLICYPNNRTDWAEMAYQFRQLWDSLNAKRGYGGEVNPWVWVISFRRL